VNSLLAVPPDTRLGYAQSKSRRAPLAVQGSVYNLGLLYIVTVFNCS